ncbi:MAG: hypothetical protein U1E78_05435 [Gammaproteobacteria bacterium]
MFHWAGCFLLFSFCIGWLARPSDFFSRMFIASILIMMIIAYIHCMRILFYWFKNRNKKLKNCATVIRHERKIEALLNEKFHDHTSHILKEVKVCLETENSRKIYLSNLFAGNIKKSGFLFAIIMMLGSGSSLYHQMLSFFPTLEEYKQVISCVFVGLFFAFLMEAVGQQTILNSKSVVSILNKVIQQKEKREEELASFKKKLLE